MALQPVTGRSHQLRVHLLALGHRHIAFISGDRRHPDATERERGYMDALAAAGVGFPGHTEMLQALAWPGQAPRPRASIGMGDGKRRRVIRPSKPAANVTTGPSAARRAAAAPRR